MLDGFNPIRWDCEKRGCFNKLKRPKIEIFHDCFPGKISFGDVDGIVEINGYGLILEWKPSPKELSAGQRIMWSRLTRGNLLSLLVVAGDAETMDVTHRAGFIDGRWRGWEDFDLARVKSWIRQWVAWALKQKREEDRWAS